MSSNSLDHLTSRELLFLKKHVELGKDHLKEYLSDQEVNDVLHLEHVSKQTKDAMFPDTAELSGHLMPAINGGIGLIFGGWMGLNGFMHLGLDKGSGFLFGVALALIVGCLLGFINFRNNEKNIKNSVEKRKFQSVEMLTLQTLIRKRKQEMEDLINQINDSLKAIGISPNGISPEADSFNPQTMGVEWLTGWAQKIKNSAQVIQEPLYSFFLEHIEQVKESFSKEQIDYRKRKGFGSVLQKLSQAPLHPPASLRSWIKSNWKTLISQAIPTIIGGFCSLFTYFDNIPKVAKVLGQEHFLYTYWTAVQPFQLLIMIGITGYFAYCFFHNNYKNFQRNKALTQAHIHIVQEEKALSLLEDNLIKVQTLDSMMQKVTPLLSIYEKVGTTSSI